MEVIGIPLNLTSHEEDLLTADKLRWKKFKSG